VEVQLQAFLTSALEGFEWSVSRSDRFTCGEGVPGTHWTGGWVGTSAGLGAVEKREIPSPSRDSDHPARSQLLNPLSYPGS